MHINQILPLPPSPLPLSLQRREQYLQRRRESDVLRGSSPLGLPIVPPTHSFIVAWSALTLFLDLTYTAILLPLAFAFGLNQDKAMATVSLTLGFLFTADMGVMLHRWGHNWG
jgi:hypothetical protein